ncbi:Transposase [Microcystis aeruginosa]
MAKLHLKVSRQPQDKAIKDALALVQCNDLVVYEGLKVRNLVKNRKLSKSISDASWYQFTEWLNYFAKIYRIVCVAVTPHVTSQDCSVCGTRVQKTLSTRTHQCPNCKTVLDREHNAAINILKKGWQYLGNPLNASTLRRRSGATSRFDFAHRRRLGIDTSTSLSVNGTVGQTETDPNALAESCLWVFSGDIENLSCLVEQGISNSNVERIPCHSVA